MSIEKLTENGSTGSTLPDIRVVGIGGAGISAIKSIQSDFDGVSFIAIDSSRASTIRVRG